MKIKFSLLLSVCVAVCFSSFAQVRLEPFWPYSKYTLGIGVGDSHMYGDLQKSLSEPVYKVNFDRCFNAYSSVGLELQHGALASEEYANHWTNGLSMYNQFTSLDLTGRVSLGQFFKYPKNYLWKNIFCLYFKTGVGIMNNDITNISLKFHNHDAIAIRDINSSSINQHTWAWYIPYNFGYNLHLTRKAVFNINYKFVYCFSDYVDGYNFPTATANNFYNDIYSVLSFSLIFNLGHVYEGDYSDVGIREKVRNIVD